MAVSRPVSEIQKAGLTEPVHLHSLVPHYVKKLAQLLESGQLCQLGIHAGVSPADKPH